VTSPHSDLTTQRARRPKLSVIDPRGQRIGDAVEGATAWWVSVAPLAIQCKNYRLPDKCLTCPKSHPFERLFGQSRPISACPNSRVQRLSDPTFSQCSARQVEIHLDPSASRLKSSTTLKVRKRRSPHNASLMKSADQHSYIASGTTRERDILLANVFCLSVFCSV
jgi:hypothetical protein